MRGAALYWTFSADARSARFRALAAAMLPIPKTEAAPSTFSEPLRIALAPDLSAQQVLGDGLKLHDRCSLVDRSYLRIAIELLQGVLLGIPEAAKKLNAQ